MYFEFYIDKKGEYRWRKKAANHQIISTAAEGFTTKRACVDNAKLNGYTGPDNPPFTQE